MEKENREFLETLSLKRKYELKRISYGWNVFWIIVGVFTLWIFIGLFLIIFNSISISTKIKRKTQLESEIRDIEAKLLAYSIANK